MADATGLDFPTYSELTRTKPWTVATGFVSPRGPEHDSETARYSEGALLGLGGMGKVVLARDSRIGREVAIKDLHGDRVISAVARARFVREARVQGQLEHPSIVPVYDIDTRPDGTTFFTMRRVLGHTLSSILDDLRIGEPLAVARYTQRELLTAFATTCLTVDYAHSRGVIHRDLKPSNIMLGDFAEVYVLDWGLARVLGDSADAVPSARLSMPDAQMGTPLYMAPEQLATPDVGPSADVFALGAILFEILTLQLLRDPSAPFVPADARASVRAPMRDIAPELDAICMRATADDPDERYPTARALHAAVGRYLDGDRDLERRRVLAAEQLALAQAALDSDDPAQRKEAMRAAGHALALDPESSVAAELVGSLLLAPPKILPPDLEVSLEAAERQQGGRRFLRGAIAYASLYVLLPLELCLDIRSWSLFILFQALVGVMVAGSLWSWHHNASDLRRGQPQRLRRFVHGGLAFGLLGNLVMAFLFTRVIGPFIITPVIVCAVLLVITANSWLNRRRWLVLIWVALAMLGPLVFERFGLLARTWWVEEGAVVSTSASFGIHGAFETTVLVATNLVFVGVFALFALGVNRDHNDAQRKLRIQAWHLGQLLPKSRSA